MNELCFPISRIRPSDVPRRGSWITAKQKVEAARGTFRDGLDISILGADLYELGEKLTVNERNHLLGAILYIIGDMEMVGTPIDKRLYKPDQWEYQIQRVAATGIKNYHDYRAVAESLEE